MRHGVNYYKVSFLNSSLETLDNKLFQDAVIKISAEELEQTDHHNSVALADGSGYIAELGVYHWLHCLVRSNT